VHDYCALQRSLVEAFLSALSPRDLERFSDVEREGPLTANEEQWRFSRHGLGVSFQRPGLVLDAHRGMVPVPDGIDGWRFQQFLESRKVAKLMMEGEEVDVEDEAGLDAGLARMVDAGLLDRVHLDGGFLVFRPTSRLLHQ